MAKTSEKQGGYGKRPLWQWILIYFVIGGLIYVAVYYLVFAKKGGYNTNNNYNNSSNSPLYPQ